MTASKKTLMLGASLNPDRASFTGLSMLADHGHPVEAFGLKAGEVAGTIIHTTLSGMEASGVHTVTLYMNAARQREYYDFILSVKPQRIFFNPGAENPELRKLAEEKGIECVEACMLVALTLDRF